MDKASRTAGELSYAKDSINRLVGVDSVDCTKGFSPAVS